jgi:hypothetical protein
MPCNKSSGEIFVILNMYHQQEFCSGCGQEKIRLRPIADSLLFFWHWKARNLFNGRQMNHSCENVMKVI